MHLFLCLPLPQLHATFPTAPPDLPITPLIVMFTGLALSSCWNVQDSLQTEPPDPVDATAHRLQLSTGRTHFNSHTHLGGLWDTKGTLTMTMNFCTWETGAEELQVTGLKGVLVKRQTKHTSTEPESLNTLLWWATTSGPNCSATEDTKIRNSTLQHCSISKCDLQSHLRLCSQSCDTRDYTEQKEFPLGGQQANPLLQMEWPSQLWSEHHKTEHSYTQNFKQSSI